MIADALGDGLLAGAAGHRDGRMAFGDQPIGGFGETLRKPAFGRPVFGAGAEDHQRVSVGDTALGEVFMERPIALGGSEKLEPVAGALNLIGADTLYGRNWGALHRFKGLYFEACFYRAIEFAIDHGLARVEAGAQGPHKISRGYVPSPTYSAHWIRDKGFSEAVESFLDRERSMMRQEMAALAHHAPYRKDSGGAPGTGEI